MRAVMFWCLINVPFCPHAQMYWLVWGGVGCAITGNLEKARVAEVEKKKKDEKRKQVRGDEDIDPLNKHTLV